MIQKSRGRIYQAFVGAIANFLQEGDPNSGKPGIEEVHAVPGIRTGEQLLITSEGLDHSKLMKLEERCSFWQTIGGMVPV